MSMVMMRRWRARRLAAAMTAVLLAGTGAAPGSATSTAIAAVSPAVVSAVTEITTGARHTCALVAGGAVRCWGYNAWGQLGNNNAPNDSHVPVAVSGLSGATSISAGEDHTCALVAGGAVACWGHNLFGKLGNNSTTDSPVPVPVNGITAATAISVGANHVCALLAGGTVSCWGGNDDGQLGDGTTNESHVPVQVNGVSGATAISAGAYHTCALVAGGAVMCWGGNGSGQLGDGSKTVGCGGTYCSLTPVAVSGLTGATAISAGGAHTCALVAGGGMCWGNNDTGQLGNDSTTASRVPVVVTGLIGATAISTGGAHTCALVGAAVECWGSNASGQLGNGTPALSNSWSTVPVEVVGVSGPTAVSAGGYGKTCALVTDGAMCWGQNAWGELGDGSTTDSNVPVAVIGLGSDTTPPDAVLARPAAATNAATLSYTLTFSEDVTGLAADDFTRTGTAAGCVVGAPVGSGASYTVDVSACSAGTVVLALKAGSVADLASNPGPASIVTAATVTVDRTAPTATAPAASLRTGASLAGTALPVKLAWTGADTGGSGVARYELATSTDGGATWGAPVSTTAASYATTVPSSGTARFRVRAVDGAENAGAWKTGPVLTPRLVEQSSAAVRYTGAWGTNRSASCSGGSARYSSRAGATASYTFTGRGIALVMTKGVTRGSVKVYVDGRLATTVSTRATTTGYRAVVWSKAFAASGRHTLKLVVAGTAGHPRVDLDALAVIR